MACFNMLQDTRSRCRVNQALCDAKRGMTRSNVAHFAADRADLATARADDTTDRARQLGRVYRQRRLVNHRFFGKRPTDSHRDDIVWSFRTAGSHHRCND